MRVVISIILICLICSQAFCLSPSLKIERKIKVVCAGCKFDFNPEINEDYLVSHGMCADCFIESFVEAGIPHRINWELVKKTRLRMEIAIRHKKMIDLKFQRIIAHQN